MVEMDYNKDYKELNEKWNNLIDFAEISLNEYEDNRKIKGLVKTIHFLLEYCDNIEDFNDKVTAFNEIKYQDITWS